MNQPSSVRSSAFRIGGHPSYRWLQREALAAVGEVISVTTLAALRGKAVPNAVNLPAASLHAPELQRLTTACGAAGRLLAVLEPDVPDAFGVTIRGWYPPTSWSMSLRRR